MEGIFESLQVKETALDTLISWQKQLLTTKFYVPVAPGPLISRPRLTTLLTKSLKYPLTLISAPAGFGKTTLLATWEQSLPENHLLRAWVSLDEEDNDPQLFWTYVLSALQKQQPQRFMSLLTQFQSPQAPPLKELLVALINVLSEATEHFVLILDDYHLITEPQVHTTLSYLVEHLPAQLRIILSTRTDPPLPITQLRARRQILEIRTDQLRCVADETKAFFKETTAIQLSDEMIREVTAHTEGWLVGLQLLGLSLSEQDNLLTLLQEANGSQRYILDYLTEEVLRQQPQEVQRFLLSTCILEQLSPALCDAIMQQTGSQQMLQWLEQANLFVVSLDSKRHWYRYHALFAEALRYQLEQTQADLVPILHHRASLWYAEHDQTTQAILHAFHAKEWQWAADLIERKSLALNALSWGVTQYQLFLLRDWLKQIPADVIRARPRLCLARIWILLFITPQTVLESWLNGVEAMLIDALTQDSHKQSSPLMPISQARQEQENLLGEAITYRALLRSVGENGEAALPLCQQALAQLSANNFGARAHIAVTQIFITYSSSVNDATAAIQVGLQASSFNQTTGNTDQAISIMGETALHMIGTGRLHETQRVAQQAILLDRQPSAFATPRVGWPMIWQAEILREWNKLDAALSCVEEAIKQLAQLEWTISLSHVLYGYAILLRVFLSRGELDAATSALQEIERIRMKMNQPQYIYQCSHFTTTDQVRLWLARGELDRAISWAELLNARERHDTPFTREREEVACVRILLAQTRPDLALQRLEPVLERATAGKRSGHVIEMRLLQAQAYQMHQEEMQALEALSEAVRLAEPEGYIRSFVDEGLPIATLLSQLREKQHKHGPNPYLNTLLTAFPQQNKEHEGQSKRMAKRTTDQSLLESLSERELQVLQLLAQGVSNREIAQELVITVDTVKRHVSHIFSKLGTQNRIQAVRQARELGLLNEKS